MTSQALVSVPLDTTAVARTVLPIELDGKEVTLEARGYQGALDHEQAMVLINRGTGAQADATALVRVHSGCVTGDIFHSLRCDCYPQLQASLRLIAAAPNGVMIYLPYQEGRAIGLVNKLKAYALQDKGRDTVDANVEIGAPIDARHYGLAAEILFDLGFGEIKLLSNNPAKVAGLEAEGIKVVSREPVVTDAHPHNEKYLETKRARMSHTF